MKIVILTSVLLVVMMGTSFGKDYVLTIDNETFELSLDNEVRVNVGGRDISVKLRQKDNLVFATDSFSFEYPKKYSPSTSDLGGGIYQTAMMTPLGVVVMVQEYENIDPASLMDMMINEVTKEERDYGYKLEATPSTRTLQDGTVLAGQVVTSRYEGSDIKRVFYTHSVNDSGLFIMTQIDYEIGATDEGLIEKFIDSLSINMK